MFNGKSKKALLSLGKRQESAGENGSENRFFFHKFYIHNTQYIANSDRYFAPWLPNEL
jgi:hypothetical protein